MKRLFLILSTLIAINNFGMEGGLSQSSQVNVKSADTENVLIISESILNKFGVLRDQKNTLLELGHQNLEDLVLEPLVEEGILRLLFGIAAVPEGLQKDKAKFYVANKITRVESSLLLYLFERASFLDFEYLELFAQEVAKRLSELSIQQLLELPVDLQGLILDVFVKNNSDKLKTLSCAKWILTQTLEYQNSPVGGHIFNLRAVSISADGRRVASGGKPSGSHNNEIEIWNLDEKGRLVGDGPVETLGLGDANLVYSISISADGKRVVASTEYDNKIRIWNLDEDGRLVGDGPVETFFVPIETLNNNILSMDIKISISADGRRIATINHIRRLTYNIFTSRNTEIKIWNLDEEGRLVGDGSVATLSLDSISSVSISKDERRVAFGSHNNEIKIWSLDKEGRFVGDGPVATLGKAFFGIFSDSDDGHTATISSVSMSKYGRRVASGSRNNEIKIWNLDEEGRLVGRSSVTTIVKPFPGFREDEAVELKVSISEDGRSVAAVSHKNEIRIWNLDEEGRLAGDGPVAILNDNFSGAPGGEGLIEISMSGDGSKIASGVISNKHPRVNIWSLGWQDCNLTLPIIYAIEKKQLTEDEIEFLKQDEGLSSSIKEQLEGKGLSKQ